MAIKLKIRKLHADAKIPSYAKPGDAAVDLTAITIARGDKQTLIYGTGLAVEIPEGHVGLLFPRSSITKYKLSLANSVGVIDSGYRGEVKVVFRHEGEVPMHLYGVGDRIAQLIILPYPQVTIETETLSDSERGQGGFGKYWFLIARK